MLSPWLKFWTVKQHRANRQALRRDHRLTLEGLEERRVLSTSSLAGIEGTIFVDNNGNGVFDAGEGINNAQVQLYRDTNNSGSFEPAADALISDKDTAIDGSYSFASIDAGNYFVVQPSQVAGTIVLQQEVSSRITFDGNGEEGQIIDTFDTATGPTVDEFPAGTPVEENFAAAEAIGGERDFLVELIGGQDGDTVRMARDLAS